MSAGTTEKDYVKIYFLLLALFTVSVLGPMAEIRWLTLITAFGIAFVKAYLVASRFMHLNIEKKYVTYLLLVMVAASALFFAGVAPDVMFHGGQGWVKQNWMDNAPPDRFGRESRD